MKKKIYVSVNKGLLADNFSAENEMLDGFRQLSQAEKNDCFLEACGIRFRKFFEGLSDMYPNLECIKYTKKYSKNFEKYMTDYSQEDARKDQMVVKDASTGAKTILQFEFSKGKLSVTGFEAEPNLFEKIEKVQKLMENSYTKRKFLSDWLAVLFRRKIISVMPNELLGMYEINHQARKYFPLYAKLDRKEQFDILTRVAEHIRRTKPFAFRDIFLYAKSTLEELQKCNLHKQFKYKGLIYHLVYDRKVNNVPEGNVIYSEYIREGRTFRDTLHSYDMWSLLHKRSNRQLLLDYYGI